MKRIEEVNCLKVKMKALSSTIVKNMFKAKQKKILKKGLVKNKIYFNKLETQIKKSKGRCFVCKKLNHKVIQCYLRHDQDSKHEGQGDIQT